jgi:mRNA-degrading endonuclease RelE of RelBE toxin-antitoxin system
MIPHIEAKLKSSLPMTAGDYQTLRVSENPKGLSEGWRVRVGGYRILYQVDDDAQTVTIVRVKGRREVYR